MRDDDFQWGWESVTEKPRQLQLDLFPVERDRYLAIAGVSLEDVNRWRAKGWISFDARRKAQLTTHMTHEIVFIRNLAESFLSNAQIDALLKTLQKPYHYDPTRIAYSFAYGWVYPPPVLDGIRIDDFVEAHLRGWIEQKVRDAEVRLLENLEETFSIAVLRAKIRKRELEAEERASKESEGSDPQETD